MWQPPLFMPDASWEPPKSLPDWRNADVIALDCETFDPDLTDYGPGWAFNNGHIVGISAAVSARERVYLPVRHEEGGNLPYDQVERWLQAHLDRVPEIVCHSAQYDVGWMEHEGFVVKPTVNCTVVMANLLDENRFSYGLDVLAKEELGEGKDETLLKETAAAMGLDAKSDLYRMHSKYVGPYAEPDSSLCLDLYNVYKPRMVEEGVWSLYEEVERPLIRLLIEMRRRGLPVSTDGAEQALQVLENRLQDCYSWFKSELGWIPDIHKAKDLQRVADEQGVKYPVTPKTGQASFTNKWMEKSPNPFIKKVIEARKNHNMKNKFLTSQILGHVKNGKLHPTVNQIKGETGGAVSGRVSYADPALQQMPSRDPILGPLIRGIFHAPDSKQWFVLDYSQQEPRLTVHYAYKLQLEGSLEAYNYYHNDPNADYHQMVAEMAEIARDPAKILNLSLAYGMGEVELCLRLGFPVEVEIDDKGVEYLVAGDEGVALINHYHDSVPFNRELSRTCTNRANSRGFIKTLLGRRCRFPLWEPTYGRSPGLPLERAKIEYKGKKLRRAGTHKAMNRLIQGSAADQTKKAMVALYRENLIPMLQMHDDLNFPFDPGEPDIKRAYDCMNEAVTLVVPNKIDVEYGPTWGEAKKEYRFA